MTLTALLAVNYTKIYFILQDLRSWFWQNICFMLQQQSSCWNVSILATNYIHINLSSIYFECSHLSRFCSSRSAPGLISKFVNEALSPLITSNWLDLTSFCGCSENALMALALVMAPFRGRLPLGSVLSFYTDVDSGPDGLVPFIKNGEAE